MNLTKGKVVSRLTRHDHPIEIEVDIKGNSAKTSIGRGVYLWANNKIVYGNK